jgi:hypothetical protein
MMNWYGKPWLGVTALLLTLAAATAGYWITGERMFMNGGLSMRHTGLSNDCAACHSPWRGVDDAKCSRCHKVTLNHKTSRKSEHVACVRCHGEHGGGKADIAQADDAECARCHKNMVHKKRKPSYTQEFARKGLLMTHATHLESKIFHRERCLKCHKNLDFIKAMSVPTPMKNIMSGHLDKVPGITCPDCHNPVEVVGFTDAAGGAMAYEKCKTCHEKSRISGACANCHRFHFLSHGYKSEGYKAEVRREPEPSSD